MTLSTVHESLELNRLRIIGKACFRHLQVFPGLLVVPVTEIKMICVRQLYIGEVRLQAKSSLDCGVTEGTSSRSWFGRYIKEIIRVTGRAIRESESGITLNRLVEKIDRIDERLRRVNNLPTQFRFVNKRFSLQIKIVRL